METTITILQDCTLYAIITIIISISSKEFGFYNLAAGIWLITGGWFGTYLYGSLNNIPIPLNFWIIPVTVVFAIIQIASPFLFEAKLRENKLAYMFISLGISLVISNLMTSFILNNHSAIIPLDQSNFALSFFLAVSALIAFGVWILLHSKFWAETVIKFRIRDLDQRVLKNLSFLIGLEILFLILLGSSTYFIHKGLYGNAEYRTLIPLLAIFFSRSQPWKAAFWSFTIVLFSHFLIFMLPVIVGDLISNEYSNFIVILSFLIIVMIKYLLRSRIFLIRVSDYLPKRFESIKKLRNEITIVIVVVLLTVSYSILISSNLVDMYANDFLQTLIIISFTIITWFIIRYLGVMTVTVPIIGLSFVLILQYVYADLIFCSILILILIVIWSLYLLVLRILPNEPAFIVDLSLLVGLHEFIKYSPSLSGSEELIMFNLSKVFKPDIILVTGFQIVIVSSILLSTVLISKSRKLRAYNLGMVNFKAGLLNGINVIKIFIVFSITTVISMLLTGVNHHLHNEPISISESSLEYGIFILFFGYFAHKANILMSITFIIILYLIIKVNMAGFGLVINIIVGILFYVIAYFLNSGKENA